MWNPKTSDRECTQPAHNILKTSPYNRTDHNRTKIGRIKFLSYFGSAMSDIHLASRNIEKYFP